MIICTQCGGEIIPSVIIDVPTFGKQSRPWEQDIWNIEKSEIYSHVICPLPDASTPKTAGESSDD